MTGCIAGMFLWVAGCLTDPEIKLPYAGYTPIQRNDGWTVSTPSEEGFDADRIAQVYRDANSEDEYPTIHSLLIARNGHLIAEAYFRDRNAIDMYHPIQSATKSITSLLSGIAIDRGLIDSVHTPVYNYIPEYFDSDVRKQQISIHHTLTMETGLDFDNDNHTIELFNDPGSSLEYVLHKPLVFLPGTDWYYGDGNPQLLSGVITRVSGKTEEAFAVEHLFNPLGIQNYQWEKHADGLTFGAFGLWLTPRDMAKIGKLMAQDGVWEGIRIVSSEWIAESTRNQSGYQEYGYYWYPMDEPGAFYAQGHGGQMIYVVQSKSLVVVVTADSYSNSGALGADFGVIFSDIFKAILD